MFFWRHLRITCQNSPIVGRRSSGLLWGFSRREIQRSLWHPWCARRARDPGEFSAVVHVPSVASQCRRPSMVRACCVRDLRRVRMLGREYHICGPPVTVKVLPWARWKSLRPWFPVATTLRGLVHGNACAERDFDCSSIFATSTGVDIDNFQL